jgi:IclR family mhp operon transcriptional activator
VKYKRIRSLARGIEVLRYFNAVKGAYPVEIGKALGLPRPTVHRILEALEGLDLVYQGPNSREFRLTPGVRSLAGGDGKYNDLRTIAWPVMRDLSAEVVWPCGLAVPHENAMLIIESTCHQSSMSCGIGMAGQSCSLLGSALGQAFLSHCSQERRDEIMADLCKHAARNDLAVEDLDDVEPMVNANYRDGFAIGLDLPQSRCASIAVPVRVDGAAIASMNIIWHVEDLTFEEAYEKLSGPLLLARERIEAQLRESVRASPALRAAGGRSNAPQAAYTRRAAASFNGLPTPQAITVATI